MRIIKEKAGFDKGQHVSTAAIYEEIPPDVQAIQYYLRNRDKQRWAESTQEAPITQILTVVSGNKKNEFDV